MLYMVRDTKVSTVTPTSDPPLRGQRSKGHFHLNVIYNFIIRARLTKIYQQTPYAHMSLQNAGFNSERLSGVNIGHWPFKVQNPISQEWNMEECFNFRTSGFWPYLHKNPKVKRKYCFQSLELIKRINWPILFLLSMFLLQTECICRLPPTVKLLHWPWTTTPTKKSMTTTRSKVNKRSWVNDFFPYTKFFQLLQMVKHGQHVAHGRRYKSVHSHNDVRPTVKGSKVKKVIFT